MNINSLIDTIGDTIDGYKYNEYKLDSFTEAVMREIKYIDLHKEVRDAFKTDSLDDILFVPGIEDDYPVTLIEFDSSNESVWLEYYVGDVLDARAYKDTENYQEDELKYFDSNTKINVLEKIKTYLENNVK